LVICAEEGIPVLVRKLEEENLHYEIVDLRKDE